MRKKRILIALVLIAVLAVGGYALGIFKKEVQETKTPSRSQLTGLQIDKKEADRPILGIMVENSREARPQTGLDSAGIVFEAVTEGGITRYLALYQEKMPEEVAPARSLRVHFLDWAMGFDASIAHVGGNAESLELARDRDANSLNEFKYKEPYRRDKSKDAPHDVVVSTEKLRKQQEELDHDKSKFNDIPRSNDAPSQTPAAKDVTINFSSPLFNVEFRYDAATNSYTRYLAGEPHIDEATNKPITVKNLIVLKLSSSNNAQLGALGNGEALVFKNGNVTEATWRQSTHKDRIRIEDAQKKEIPLNRGDSWFAALPDGRTVTY